MRKISCHECGKTYDYDLHDFCPRCGGFTQPKKHLRFDGRGRIVRVDGINEQNHRGSFVHAERHQEEKQRREKGLSREKDELSRLFEDLGLSTSARTKSAQKGGQEGKKKGEGFPIALLVILYLLFRMIANR